MPNKNSDQSSSDGDDLSTLRAERDTAIHAAQDAVYNTTRLTRLLTILSEPAPLQLLFDRLLETLSELFAADVVVLLDPAGTGSFSPLASIGLPEDLAQCKFSEAEDSYVVETMKNRFPILVSNARTDQKIDPQLHEIDVETAIWLPIIGSSASRGVLLLARCRPIPFAHTDIDILAAMTYRIGLALERAQHSIQIEWIAQSSHKLGRHLDQTTICSEASRRFPSIMGADAAALVLIETESADCSITLARLDPSLNSIWCNLANRYLEENVFTGHEVLNIPFQDIIGDLHIAEVPNNCPVHTLLAAPILIEDQLKGVLFAMRFSSIPFNPDTLKIAMLYAGQTSAALENARLYRAVREELAVRQRVEQALRARDERFSAMIRSVSDVIAILNVAGIISYASPAVEVTWGCSAEALHGQSILSLVHPEEESVMRNMLSAVQEQPNITLTGFARIKQNENHWRAFDVIMTNLIHDPAVSGIVSTYHDITERKIYEQELTNLAYRDALTGLANRAFFVKHLRDALFQANSISQSVGLIFFDVDNFKIVNDSLGHDKGDEVLKTVADRVRGCLRREDTAARLGGDEFTVLIENVKSNEQVVSIARRILGAMREPFWLVDREIYVGCSIGIAISVPMEDGPDNLLRKADLAMYKAKSNGKGGYAVFDMHMNAKAIERLELETELRMALARKEFRVYYQPIISLDAHQVVEVEALIRWQHPYRGLISPSEIIPLAEETGLIIEIGQWLLEEACRQVFAWKNEFPDLSSISLSVNLSARQFQNAGLVSGINQAIGDSGLDSSSLTLEITESSLIKDPDAMITKLNALKDIGVHLAIDDFGTGYASLSYLKQFPVDVLKIDRSFIQGIVCDARDKAIVQSMIDLAISFGLNVIGEGIETEEQAAKLFELGCNRAQGYLFSKPLSAASFESRFGKTGRV